MSATETSAMQIMSWGICYCSVCVPADSDRDAIARWVNSQLPTGIESRWTIETEAFSDGAPNPCPCSDHRDGRLHYLLSC